MNPAEYESFLVRFWRDQPCHEQPGCWHGEIEHIQSGLRQHFSTLRDLMAFLQQAAVAPQVIEEPTQADESTLSVLPSDRYARQDSQA